MELLLNSAWALVGLISLCLWLRIDCPDKTERRRSLVALFLLVVILFPVISVSDDIWSAQNPAEENSLQRRDRLIAITHPIPPVIAAVPVFAIAQQILIVQRVCAPLLRSIGTVESPAFDVIENRPPPATA